MKKILFCISIIFISLLINRLSAQLPKQQLERSDSLQYIVKGEKNRFFGKFKEDNLRWGFEGKVIFVINTKGDTIHRETDPEYSGGESAMYRFLANVVKYPPRARDKGAQGKVYVRFMVNIDGSLQDIHVVYLQKTTHDNIAEEFFNELKEESVRVIRLMPNWTPATEQNKPKRALYTMPIVFWVE